MKTLITTLLAAALVIPAAAQAQPIQRDDRPHYSQQDARNDRHRQQQAAPSRQQQPHRFSKGERFERSRATNYRRVDYRQNRKLSAPPRNQVWVRSGSDALLVLLSNNIVQRVVPNAF